MATMLLAHESDPTDARACGIGRTRKIARDRAIAMWLDRRAGIRDPQPDDIAAVEYDIEQGNIVAMTFG